jgi:hypothetical protein
VAERAAAMEPAVAPTNTAATKDANALTFHNNGVVS